MKAREEPQFQAASVEAEHQHSLPPPSILVKRLPREGRPVLLVCLRVRCFLGCRTFCAKIGKVWSKLGGVGHPVLKQHLLPTNPPIDSDHNHITVTNYLAPLTVSYSVDNRCIPFLVVKWTWIRRREKVKRKRD